MISKHIPFALKRIKEQIEKGYSPIIVVSALNGVTDKLFCFLNLLKESRKRNCGYSKKVSKFVRELKEIHLKIIEDMKISSEQKQETEQKLAIVFKEFEQDLNAVARFEILNIFQDKIISYGEKISAVLFAAYLRNNKINAVAIMAEEIPIITNNNYLNADIEYKISEKNVIKKFKNFKAVAVIPGFTGLDDKKNTTTLGRGGTDTTACFVGAALRANKIILWKDVDGVMSADPKVVPGAITVPYISYLEAEEAGKIIQDKAIRYIKKFNIKTEVASIINPKGKTIIGPPNSRIKGAKIISFKKGLLLLTITDDSITSPGFIYEIGKVFIKHNINMILIRNTRETLQIVIDNTSNNFDKVLGEFKNKKFIIKICQVNMVTLVGNLSWNMVNDFNSALKKICGDPQIGSFPYKNCVRLEAIIKTDETEKIIS